MADEVRVPTGELNGVRWEAARDATSREIAKGVFLDLPGRAVFDTGVHVDGECTVTVGFEWLEMKAVLTSLKVEMQNGQPVTGVLLRQVPVRELERLALRAGVHAERAAVEIGDRVFSFPGVLTEESVQHLGEKGPVPETLQAVAYIYRAAAAVGDPPVKAVTVNFGVSRPTATRWVRKARQEGYLDVEHSEEG